MGGGRNRKRNRGGERESDRELANEAARLALDDARLPTYLFAIVLSGSECIVEVEHPRNGAWRRTVLRAPTVELVASLDDPSRRGVIARAWSAELARADAA